MLDLTHDGPGGRLDPIVRVGTAGLSLIIESEPPGGEILLEMLFSDVLSHGRPS